MSVLPQRAAAPAAPIPGHPKGGVFGPAYRTLSIGIISVIFLIAFEATAVGTAMPVAARELDGIALYAFAFSAYFTTSLFGMVLSGQWADRQGPLRPLTVGIGSFAAGLVCSGTAGAMWMFVLGRAVQGFGGGLVIVALYVVVSRAYEERLRPAIMAAFAASWVVPSIVGPLAAGTVTEHLGWRWVFLGIPRWSSYRSPWRCRRYGGAPPGRWTPRLRPWRSTGGGSGWRWGSRSGRGCCSTRRRT